MIRAAAAGSRTAFAALYAQHRGGVLARLSYLVGPRATVEDLLQDTFEKAYRALPSFRGECPFRWWLLRIAMSVARSEQRSFRRSLWRLFLGEAEELAAQPESPAQAEQYPDLVLVHAMLRKLSPRLREAVVLFELEGLTLAEMAGELNLPLATAAARVRRGRAALRAELDKVVGKDARAWLPCRGEVP